MVGARPARPGRRSAVSQEFEDPDHASDPHGKPIPLTPHPPGQPPHSAYPQISACCGAPTTTRAATTPPANWTRARVRGVQPEPHAAVRPVQTRLERIDDRLHHPDLGGGYFFAPPAAAGNTGPGWERAVRGETRHEPGSRGDASRRQRSQQSATSSPSPVHRRIARGSDMSRKTRVSRPTRLEIRRAPTWRRLAPGETIERRSRRPRWMRLRRSTCRARRRPR